MCTSPPPLLLLRLLLLLLLLLLLQKLSRNNATLLSMHGRQLSSNRASPVRFLGRLCFHRLWKQQPNAAHGWRFKLANNRVNRFATELHLLDSACQNNSMDQQQQQLQQQQLQQQQQNLLILIHEVYMTYGSWSVGWGRQKIRLTRRLLSVSSTFQWFPLT